MNSNKEIRFIKHHDHNDAWNSISIMETSGLAFARGYYYNNDSKTFYLDQLSVSLDFRNNGIGTKLQEVREEIAKEKGFKYTMLWVKKGTWMRKWYKRRGYKYYAPYKDEKAVWLRKLI